MNQWPKPDTASLRAFYGNPDANGDGVPDRAWEDTNLVSLPVVYPMVLAWDVTKSVRTLRVHKKVAPSLGRVLAQIVNYYGTHEAIQAARMHLWGGGYNFRPMRGAASLSIHSYGAAIDLDPERNAFRRKYGAVKDMMPMRVVEIFQSEGWKWGGPWKTPDAMHFEATS